VALLAVSKIDFDFDQNDNLDIGVAGKIASCCGANAWYKGLCVPLRAVIIVFL